MKQKRITQADATSEPAKLLVVQVAGLGWDFFKQQQQAQRLLPDFNFAPLSAPFPAVTCVAQATFRTASPPSSHGVVANGWFDRSLAKSMFWEQSARLVRGERIWRGLRQHGGKVAMLFWQQSLGEEVDILLSPAPIHKHHGGMIDDCYSNPPNLYQELVKKLKTPFRLRDYWGPLASARGSNWIAQAACEVLAGSCAPAPDLCLLYLPALDYDLQRYGPDGAAAREALAKLVGELALLRQACERHGYEMLIYGDYAIKGVSGRALYPNRALRAAGLLQTRQIGRRHYLDLYRSRAAAIVDHQVAHVYVRDRADIVAAGAALLAMPGIGEVLDTESMTRLGVAHERGGELLLTAARGRWFAYPWWERASEAPDYAGHVDIHNKPGFDPCELFWGWPPGTVSQNSRRIRGSHGLTGEGYDACWASTFLNADRMTLEQLALAAKNKLEKMLCQKRPLSFNA